MIVTLKFDLRESNENLSQERESLKAALAGEKNKRLIDELYDVVFRKYLKYEASFLDKNLTSREYALAQSIWDEINEHFNEGE